MDRTIRFLLSAAIVFAASFWFFSVQPWMEAATGWYRWYLTIMHASELLALYALGYGLFVLAGADATRWRKTTGGCVLISLGLLVHAFINYQGVSSEMNSPLLPTYLTDHMKRPYLWRIGIAVMILITGGLGHYFQKLQVTLFITILALAFYRLAPELHSLIHPLENVTGQIDAEKHLLLAQGKEKLP